MGKITAMIIMLVLSTVATGCDMVKKSNKEESDSRVQLLYEPPKGGIELDSWSGEADFDFDGDWTPYIAVVDKDIYESLKDGCYHDDFLTMAFHKGKVMSIGEYANYHNEGKDLNDRIESVALYDYCYEMCAECEAEVQLEIC
jgi:hypothetical protein